MKKKVLALLMVMVMALALLAAIICLLVRKGYQGEENTRRLTSVAAAAN